MSTHSSAWFCVQTPRKPSTRSDSFAARNYNGSGGAGPSRFALLCVRRSPILAILPDNVFIGAIDELSRTIIALIPTIPSIPWLPECGGQFKEVNDATQTDQTRRVRFYSPSTPCASIVHTDGDHIDFLFNSDRARDINIGRGWIPSIAVSQFYPK